jgi:hypothetical protein
VKNILEYLNPDRISIFLYSTSFRWALPGEEALCPLPANFFSGIRVVYSDRGGVHG